MWLGETSQAVKQKARTICIFKQTSNFLPLSFFVLTEAGNWGRHTYVERGGGRRKGGLYLTALIMESVNICFVRIPVLDALIVLIDFGKLCHLNILDVMYQSWGAWSFWKGWLYFPKGQKEKKGAMGSVWRQLEWKDGCTVENTHAPLLYATQTLPAFLVFSQSDTINRKTCWSHF